MKALETDVNSRPARLHSRTLSKRKKKSTKKEQKKLMTQSSSVGTEDGQAGRGLVPAVPAETEFGSLPPPQVTDSHM